MYSTIFILIVNVKQNGCLSSFTSDAGQTVYTCMLNHKGLTEADLTVSVIEPGSGAPHAPKFEGKYVCTAQYQSKKKVNPL